jgi:hypothetical protein
MEATMPVWRRVVAATPAGQFFASKHGGSARLFFPPRRYFARTGAMRSPRRAQAFVRNLLALLVVSASGALGATLEIKGRTFTLDGKPFDMWGIRVAGASQSQAFTDQLIEQLDTYREHGVNTVSVYYMGCSAAYSDPFSPDGRSIDPDHQRRMEAILRACDQRGMVAIVGVFYQRSDAPRLKDWEAARTAVETVATSLRPHRNAILNIANEQNSTRYQRMPWARVMNPDDVIELARVARAAAPRLIVGAGGYDHAKNESIGRAAEIDTLLFDTNGPQDSGQLFARFRDAGVNKPMVNVETFGAWTAKFLPQGVFPDEARRAYLSEIAAAAQHEGLYLHFHNNPWCQPTPAQGRVRYDLGGSGTPDDPGIRWYFDAVRTASRASAAGR